MYNLQMTSQTNLNSTLEKLWIISEGDTSNFVFERVSEVICANVRSIGYLFKLVDLNLAIQDALKNLCTSSDKYKPYAAAKDAIQAELNSRKGA
jgi:hypothetical protein